MKYGMINKIFLLFVLAGLTACENKPVSEIEALREMVKDRIDSDMANLATFESVYYLVYKNKESKTMLLLGGNEFYIRQEVASVPYGYSVSDISVDVISDQGRNVLKVSLPAKPKRMPINRKMARRSVMSSEYEIEDESGKTTDIDAIMNSNLQEMIDKYERSAMDSAKDLTNQYFDNLARSLSLDKPKIEYRE